MEINKIEIMKSNVNWLQFLAGILGILATVITIYFSLRSTIVTESRNYENHEQRLGALETNFKEFKIEMREGFSDIRQRQERMTDKQQEMLIILQNKQNRK